MQIILGILNKSAIKIVTSFAGHPESTFSLIINPLRKPMPCLQTDEVYWQCCVMCFRLRTDTLRIISTCWMIDEVLSSLFSRCCWQYRTNSKNYVSLFCSILSQFGSSIKRRIMMIADGVRIATVEMLYIKGTLRRRLTYIFFSFNKKCNI